MRLRLGSAWILGAAIGAFTLGACFSFGDLSGNGDGSTDGGSDALISGDGSASDGAAGDGGRAEGGPPGPCAGTAGPKPIRVTTSAGTFCIDSTEVTLRDYRAFLTATDGGATVVPLPECAWDPGYGGSAGDLFDPVTNVNWCDAWAYCQWAGKHLCGMIGGGAVGYDSTIGDPKKSEWLAACSYASDGGVQTYPYGNTPSATACNGAELDAGALVEVGTLPECVGGVPGIFDMSGNVDEWIDSCDGKTGRNDCCVTAGGGFRDFETPCGVGDTAAPSCSGRTRSDVHSDVGFRCCSE